MTPVAAVLLIVAVLTAVVAALTGVREGYYLAGAFAAAALVALVARR